MRHVDFRPQCARAFGEFAFSHPLEQFEILCNRPIAERTVLAWRGQRAAILANLIGIQIANVRLAGFHELNGPGVNLLEVVAGIQRRRYVEAKPAHILFDRLHILFFFFGRIRIVEPQIARAVVFDRQPEIQADAFGVPDVQVAIRLRRKPCLHTITKPAVRACSSIISSMKFSERGSSGMITHPSVGYSFRGRSWRSCSSSATSGCQ